MSPAAKKGKKGNRKLMLIGGGVAALALIYLLVHKQKPAEATPLPEAHVDGAGGEGSTTPFSLLPTKAASIAPPSTGEQVTAQPAQPLPGTNSTVRKMEPTVRVALSPATVKSIEHAELLAGRGRSIEHAEFLAGRGPLRKAELQARIHPGQPARIRLGGAPA